MKLVARSFPALLAMIVIFSMSIPSITFTSDEDYSLMSVSLKSSSLSVSGKALNIRAYTQSYILEDIISVTSTLQQKKGSIWTDLYTWSTVTAYNSNYVLLTKTYTGTSGKAYRIRSVHYTRTGSTTDTETSYSSTVAVN